MLNRKLFFFIIRLPNNILAKIRRFLYMHSKTRQEDLEKFESKTGFNHWSKIEDQGYDWVPPDMGVPGQQGYFVNNDHKEIKFQAKNGQMVILQ